MSDKKINIGLFGKFRLRVASMSITVPQNATDKEIAGLAKTLAALADNDPEALWSLEDGQYLTAGEADTVHVDIENQHGDAEVVDYRFIRKNGKLVLDEN